MLATTASNASAVCRQASRISSISNSSLISRSSLSTRRARDRILRLLLVVRSSSVGAADLCRSASDLGIEVGREHPERHRVGVLAQLVCQVVDAMRSGMPQSALISSSDGRRPTHSSPKRLSA